MYGSVGFKPFPIDEVQEFVDEKGYVRVLYPEHPHSNRGYVYKHRVVMENHLGRFIDPSQVVHHINEIKTDNRLLNLYLCSSEEHVQIHNRSRGMSASRKNAIRQSMLRRQSEKTSTRPRRG